MVMNIMDQISEINTNPSSSNTQDLGVNISVKCVWIYFFHILILLFFIQTICRDSYSATLAHETKLFKMCALQSNALKSLEVIMTSSMCIDVIVNAKSSKSKQSNDANKNVMSDTKRSRNNIKDYTSMNEILIFLFR